MSYGLEGPHGAPSGWRGVQVPRIELIPPAASTAAGEEAIELATVARMTLDPWECRVVRGALGQDHLGQWAAPEVGLVVGRQNGKGTCIEVVILDGLYLRRSKIVYTAHLMATSRKFRERIQVLIESCPDLDKEVKQVRISNEEQSIVLKKPDVIITGSGPAAYASREEARVDFVARTGSASRGWTNYDLIFFDEAFALSVEMVGAIMPIMFARQNWQLWYVSMGGMANSHALRQVRIRAINGEPDLAYLEWSVDEAYHEAPEYVANMPAAWAQANPAAGERITFKTIQRAQRSMDPAVFAREVLCVWDDPGGMLLIHPALWSRLADATSEITSGVICGFDASPGLVSGVIGACGYRPDGIPLIEVTSRGGVLDYRHGTDWMPARIKEIDAAQHPHAWLYDAGGPAAALVPAIQKAIPGIDDRLVGLDARALGKACGGMLVAVTAPNGDRLRHLGQPCMLDAIKAAKKRDVVDTWVWSRRHSELDISPLMVGTIVLYGLALYDVMIYDMTASVL